MRFGYKQRLFFYLAIVFLFFTIGVVLFGQSREKKVKTEALEEKLDIYANLLFAGVSDNDGDVSKVMDSLDLILPPNIRISVIDSDGVLVYDNSLDNLEVVENHAGRREIIDAAKRNKGRDIRTSASNEQEYLYYARKFDTKFIRVALPYDIQTRRFLKSDNAYLYFILGLFFIILFLINLITNRFSRSIKYLWRFTMRPDEERFKELVFPDDELGEIGLKIAENYRQLRDRKQEVDMEREKLLQHVHSSEEGVCFFSHDRGVQFNNGLFIQYLNTLLDEPGSEPSLLFSNSLFDDMIRFLDANEGSYFEDVLRKHGKVFSLRVNKFDDLSFEIVLNDITKSERTRLLKQEMTSNIAHELRTPVTSVRGYLETVLDLPLDDEKKKYFIQKAYEQTIVLSELIQDMSLITKIEEAPQSLALEDVDVSALLDKLRLDMLTVMKDKGVEMNFVVPDNLVVRGNMSLLYSIFRNLTDNSIRYAGEGVKIFINVYNEDKNYYYFSFYDTGVGVADERHLKRLFERFYRISDGRTRDTGGSGLGLSIVKNAVAFHKGTIIAKNRKEGGLEFLFQIHK